MQYIRHVAGGAFCGQAKLKEGCQWLPIQEAGYVTRDEEQMPAVIGCHSFLQTAKCDK